MEYSTDKYYMKKPTRRDTAKMQDAIRRFLRSTERILKDLKNRGKKFEKPLKNLVTKTQSDKATYNKGLYTCFEKLVPLV